MFQGACRDLLKTLMPIVVAWRTARGKVGFGIGAGMMLNEEGWFITAGHILQQIADLDVEVSSPKPRGKRKSDRVTHYASIFGTTKAPVALARVRGDVDIGVGKLEGYKPQDGEAFPRFRIREVEQGELLCRAGYPFVDDIRPEWSDKNGFKFSNLFPLPMFVNEAFVSRFANVGDRGVWIETSSPGLKGQSGGPLVDTDGLVCGTQVNTHHYPLEFEGKGRNQVLNVGRAVAAQTIRAFLKENDFKHLTEEDGNG